MLIINLIKTVLVIVYLQHHLLQLILNVLPALAGLSCADSARFNAVFHKSVIWGILDRLFDFDELTTDDEN
jgi:hypothetical protein